MALQTLRYGLDPYGYFRSAQRAFGDVFTVRVLHEVIVVLADPRDVRALYALGPGDVDSGVANWSLRPLLGTQNSLLLDGDAHLRRRRLVLPPFHGERMRAYEGLIRAATRAEIATWPAGGRVHTLAREDERLRQAVDEDCWHAVLAAGGHAGRVAGVRAAAALRHNEVP